MIAGWFRGPRIILLVTFAAVLILATLGAVLAAGPATGHHRGSGITIISQEDSPYEITADDDVIYVVYGDVDVVFIPEEHEGRRVLVRCIGTASASLTTTDDNVLIEGGTFPVTIDGDKSKEFQYVRAPAELRGWWVIGQ